MNFLKPEYIDRIEELANLLTHPQDIAYILQLDEHYFALQLRNEESEIYKAFYTGYLQRETEIRKENKDVIDVDSAEFSMKQLKDFKSQLILFLDA